jgi:hypothetical protein
MVANATIDEAKISGPKLLGFDRLIEVDWAGA